MEYPHKFQVSIPLAEVQHFRSLQPGERSGTRVSVAGKIMEIKCVEREVTCYVVESGSGKLPVWVDNDRVQARMNRGDVVGVTGFPAASRLGELGVDVESLRLLAPCLRELPERTGEQESWKPGKPRDPTAYQLSQETRYADRVLDLLVNPEVKTVFGARSETVTYVRSFMKNGGLTEVNTGILEQRVAAKSFKTRLNELNLDMALRVSSNQLLQLIVADYMGVFEIGKQFRNEEMDPTHSPEYTTCQMYRAYADYKDLMEMTEELVSGLVLKITGGYQVLYHSNDCVNPPVLIDFTPPFRRIKVVNGLEEALDLQFPEDLASEEGKEFLIKTCESHGIGISTPVSTASLLHSLARCVLETRCVAPTFIVDYPEVNPLAKRLTPTSVFAEHFKLFVSRNQLVSAFTHRRDPLELSKTHELRTLMEYGLPPCSSWVMGMDRMVMLLTDSLDIKEVLLYPIVSSAAEELEEPVQDEQTSHSRTVESVATVMHKLEQFSLKTGRNAEVAVTEELDPTQYYDNRLASISCTEETYSRMFNVSMSLECFRKKFESVSKGERLLETTIFVGGRVMSRRTAGSKLLFFDIESAEGQIQAVVDARTVAGNFVEIQSNIKRGDVVGVWGAPGKSKSGELSIFAKDMVLLAPCLYMLPKGGKTRDDQWTWQAGKARNPNDYVLRDQETRYRLRFLDCIVNPDVKNIFKAGHDAENYIRSFLRHRGFIEVETAMLNWKAGGAAARPFSTHHDQTGTDMHLRISPELQLKQLLVASYSGVFEIGKQFRNEGMDLTHNPEFTSCEFYSAYDDYEDLMKMTEELLSGLVLKITGEYKLCYHSDGYDKPPVVIDFTPPFRRIEMVKGLEDMMDVQLPEDLDSEEANEFLREACKNAGVSCAPPLTTSRLLDKLVGHFLEETCLHPTFIINHPLIMSPLAKRHRLKPSLTERFELFVNKHELVNAYTELNNPVEQRERFIQQQKDRQVGDDEAMVLDEEFVKSLEYGLPPCAGWGIGVDRLVMLLTDSLNIKEVLLCPAMKPETCLSTNEMLM